MAFATYFETFFPSTIKSKLKYTQIECFSIRLLYRVKRFLILCGTNDSLDIFTHKKFCIYNINLGSRTPIKGQSMLNERENSRDLWKYTEYCLQPGRTRSDKTSVFIFSCWSTSRPWWFIPSCHKAHSFFLQYFMMRCG